MRHQQEKQNSLQSLQTPEMSSSRYVKKRLQIRQTVKLVQDPLPSARTTTAATAASSEHEQRPDKLETPTENTTIASPTPRYGAVEYEFVPTSNAASA